MLERFFKACVAVTADARRRDQITAALTVARVPYTYRVKDVNRRNVFDQGRTGSLGIRPQYVTEIFVDKENAARAQALLRTL